MRWPSSPGHGTVSSPGSSFWNFTHITLRPLLLVDWAGGGAGAPQESAMLEIVMDLSGREHRQLGIDLERQVRVRRPQRPIDIARLPGAREDEAQITGAFRQRHEQLIRLRGDPDILDVRLA